jgi:hypothetical protein
MLSAKDQGGLTHTTKIPVDEWERWLKQLDVPEELLRRMAQDAWLDLVWGEKGDAPLIERIWERASEQREHSRKFESGELPARWNKRDGTPWEPGPGSNTPQGKPHQRVARCDKCGKSVPVSDEEGGWETATLGWQTSYEGQWCPACRPDGDRPQPN